MPYTILLDTPLSIVHNSCITGDVVEFVQMNHFQEYNDDL